MTSVLVFVMLIVAFLLGSVVTHNFCKYHYYWEGYHAGNRDGWEECELVWVEESMKCRNTTTTSCVIDVDELSQ